MVHLKDNEYPVPRLCFAKKLIKQLLRFSIPDSYLKRNSITHMYVARMCQNYHAVSCHVLDANFPGAIIKHLK